MQHSPELLHFKPFYIPTYSGLMSWGRSEQPGCRSSCKRWHKHAAKFDNSSWARSSLKRWLHTFWSWSHLKYIFLLQYLKHIYKCIISYISESFGCNDACHSSRPEFPSHGLNFRMHIATEQPLVAYCFKPDWWLQRVVCPGGFPMQICQFDVSFRDRLQIPLKLWHTLKSSFLRTS